MRPSLADNLNLCGTARYNQTIRHKLRLVRKDQRERIKIPAAWEMTVSYNNNLQLAYINFLAKEANTAHVPFKEVEPLPQDNGEQFFSEYLQQQNHHRQTTRQDHPND